MQILIIFFICKQISEFIKIFLSGNALIINPTHAASMHCVHLYSLCACAYMK